MTKYQPATSHSDSIRRPECSKCGTAMLLFGIEAESPGRELLSFECPRCQNIESRTGNSE
jgi:phage FluMu protein Com